MKILIIEDDKSIAELEMDYLSANGFECELANDGESGLKKALDNDYDLVCDNRRYASSARRFFSVR